MDQQQQEAHTEGIPTDGQRTPGNSLPELANLTFVVVNPRRACAARVTVVGFVCLCVTLNLTSRVSVRPRNDTIYPTGDEGQNICGVFSENAPLQS